MENDGRNHFKTIIFPAKIAFHHLLATCASVFILQAQLANTWRTGGALFD
jgi:hypothetical protein